MPRSSWFIVLAVLTACSDRRQRDVADEELVVAAVPINAWSRFPERRFGIGLASEVRVFGDLGIEHFIRQARCLDDGCTIEARPNEIDPRHPMFILTPKAHTFRIRLELDERVPTVIERNVEAVDGTMFALHRGAGPGVPFVAGMQVTWYVGTKELNVSWDPTLSSITVTPPFELVNAPIVGGGSEGDSLIRVTVRAPEDLATTTTGALEHRNGDAATSFSLIAVPRADVAKLHVAPAPDAPSRDDVEDEKTIAALSEDSIIVPLYRPRWAWVVFQTRSGRFGLAGAGECLPARNATFGIEPPYVPYYSFDIGDDAKAWRPEDQPTLGLRAGSKGASQLILAFGDVTNTIDVIGSEAQ